MDVLLRIGSFVLFIVVYALWLGVNNYTVKFAGRAIAQNQLIKSSFISWAQTMFVVVVYTVLIFLMSGVFSFSLILILGVGITISTIFQIIIQVFFDSPRSHHLQYTFWIGFETAAKHRFLQINRILAGIVVLAYPVLAGIIYLTVPFPSEELTTLSFRFILSLALIAAVIFSYFVSFLNLISPNLDNRIRNIYMLQSIVGMLPMTLYYGLVFWAFNITENSVQLDLNEVQVSFSVTLVVLLTAYFVILLLLPYLIGWRRHQSWVQHLHRAKLQLISDVIEILEAPTGGLYETKLVEFQNKVELDIDAFLESDALVIYAAKSNSEYSEYVVSDAELARNSEEIQLGVYAYRNSRELDPRINFLDWNEKFLGRLTETKDDLAQEETEQEKQQEAQQWVKFYRSIKQDLQDNEPEKRTARPLVWAGIGFVVTAVFSIVLEKATELAWNVISQGAP